MSATGSGTKEADKLSSTALRYCRRFSLAEIRSATGDFNGEHLIGEGGFGKVYKGQINDGQQTVAMKRLAPNSNQGEGEFLTEIETLSKLRHINLVSLIGYCNEDGEMILVYEYISRGTMADHLYTLSRSKESKDCSSLTWKQRLNICIGAGRGLDYLHTGTSIIHRDVKSTNILLDENFTAKVSDFGLAKYLSTRSSKSYVSTMVKGTFGYLDPSYFTTSRLTQKSDTYAFGVILLEVLCGRPPVNPRLGENEMSLVMWALQKISKGKVDQIVASNLRDEISANCLKAFVGIAKRCVNHNPKKRPTMAHVVAQLEFALEQQDKKATSFNTSRLLLFLDWVIPSGSRATGSIQKDHEPADVNMLSLTAIPEEALKDELTVSVPAIAIDKSVVPIAFPPITINELKVITNNFSWMSLIHHKYGANVYRGVLKNGQVAAIKKLVYNRKSMPDEMFYKQVSIISSLQHENVAKLLCYCVNGDKQLLAYEYGTKGSLHDNVYGEEGLNGRKPGPALSWDQRAKIAMGAAKGLEYIHKKELIHYNVKSSNILLFEDYQVAKLVDFGLPIQSTSDLSYLLHDYDPPGWPCEVSWRTDVYSFGVVLVELLTGCKAIAFTWPEREQCYLKAWVKPWLSDNDKGKEIWDARMNGDYPPKDISKMAKIAAACLQDAAVLRPEMSKVVSDLYEIFPFPESSMQ